MTINSLYVIDSFFPLRDFIVPLFDYTCPSCDHTFDKIAKHDESVPCPKCGNIAKKDIVAPSFMLKGQGFHSPGTYVNAKQGPKLDKDFMRLSDKEQNKELGLPDDCIC